jgi:hypothetical protein
MNRSAFVIVPLDHARHGDSKVSHDSRAIDPNLVSHARRTVLVWLLALGGCADKELDASSSAGSPGDSCVREDQDDCAEGLACEPVAGSEGDHVCAVRLEIRGSVIDALDGEPIVDAQVVATDEPGAPVTAVARTDAEGRYVLTVSVPRDGAGALAEGRRWTLLVSARDYLAFPGALRPALPIDAQDAAPLEEEAPGEDPSVIDNAATVVALIPLAADQAGGVTLTGRVEGERASGTLVVAEGLAPAPMAVADLDGSFTLFNVPAGTATVRGYRQGVELEPVTLSVGSEDIDDVRLAVITERVDAMAVVEGSVTIVDAEGGLRTSVVLVPSSVYQPAFEQGPVPFGLRAPAPPEAPSISSSFAITGVPAGVYRVLAAVENDGLVRDPDASIAGTQILEIEVAAGAAVELASSFKITEALTVVGPGADAPEEVDGAPTFAWIDDASEDRYEIAVYDARGTAVWRDDQLPRVTGGGTVQVPYGGPALVSGMFHQFRVTSWSDGPQGSTALTRTEDLRGVFVAR